MCDFKRSLVSLLQCGLGSLSHVGHTPALNRLLRAVSQRGPHNSFFLCAVLIGPIPASLGPCCPSMALTTSGEAVPVRRVESAHHLDLVSSMQYRAAHVAKPTWLVPALTEWACRCLLQRADVLPEGVHAHKYLPITALYTEETTVQVRLLSGQLSASIVYAQALTLTCGHSTVYREQPVSVAADGHRHAEPDSAFHGSDWPESHCRLRSHPHLPSLPAVQLGAWPWPDR